MDAVAVGLLHHQVFGLDGPFQFWFYGFQGTILHKVW